MFQDPSSNRSSDIHIKPGKYLGQLVRLEDGGDGQYGPRVKWVWALYNTGKNAQGIDDPTVVLPMYGADGELYEYWTRTSTKFGKNPKTGKVAQARLWAEKMLNRDIRDDEKGADIAAELPGKKAVLHLVGKLSADGVNTYLNIEFIEPYVKGTLAPVIPLDGEAFNDDDEDAENPLLSNAELAEAPF